MTKRIIHVFPDYCSTCLWDGETGKSVSLHELGINRLVLQISLSILLNGWVSICDSYEEEVDKECLCELIKLGDNIVELADSYGYEDLQFVNVPEKY